ncbi:MAG: hypothetical protein QF824_01730 [Candidatus Woesearchaeota archaeon]|jgi:hypothetical protein|nr:hypothetical protein [Candidatus Woesearchaeota archaeon]
MATLKQLEQEVGKLKQRNMDVESNKGWETSWTRRSLLMLFTYLAIGFYLYVIEVSNPWLNAIVPAFAFMLSTLSLPFFKKLWLKRVKK